MSSKCHWVCRRSGQSGYTIKVLCVLGGECSLIFVPSYRGLKVGTPERCHLWTQIQKICESMSLSSSLPVSNITVEKGTIPFFSSNWWFRKFFCRAHIICPCSDFPCLWGMYEYVPTSSPRKVIEMYHLEDKRSLCVQTARSNAEEHTSQLTLGTDTARSFSVTRGLRLWFAMNENSEIAAFTSASDFNTKKYMPYSCQVVENQMSPSSFSRISSAKSAQTWPTPSYISRRLNHINQWRNYKSAQMRYIYGMHMRTFSHAPFLEIDIECLGVYLVCSSLVRPCQYNEKWESKWKAEANTQLFSLQEDNVVSTLCTTHVCETR